MIFLPQNPVGYFCNIVLALLLCQVAICVEDSIGLKVNQKSSLSVVSTNTSSKPNLTESVGNRSDVTKTITKQTLLSRDDSPVDLSDPERTTKASLSHDNIPSNTGLPQHSTDAPISSTQVAISNTSASLVRNSTSSAVRNVTAASIPESHPPSVPPAAPSAVPVHKSKPETTVDEVVRDSGPSTDYVVPLVVAMLAVPLVGVLCALMYMKGRDFWERRHYGRIDFLWDSRNESRMDFLIDGMYNN